MSSTTSMSTTATVTSSASASASSAHGLSLGTSNPAFKIVGVCLAIGSGLFIGTSFVVKKKGLLRATQKYGNKAGEGHAYLKSWLWWTGMIMMILGEVLNFVAYYPGYSTRVSIRGHLRYPLPLLPQRIPHLLRCTLCIIGATILALNAPEEQSTQTIAEFQHFFIAPGFLVWAGLCIVTALVIVFYVAPRWGRKNMMPYITICSLIGGISVSCTQGLGSSIVTSIQGNNQVKNWFFWFLFVFVVITLLVEINYLNKALELFNTSMVVPVYFCFFSSATLITSFILYQGLKASAIQLITMTLGFFTICLGITLLQMSKVDPKVFSNLDRRSTMMLEAGRHPIEAEEKGDVAAMEDPGMDALRGGFGAVGSVIRARSVSRRLSSVSGISHQGRVGWPYGNKDAELSTHGLENLQRYQLSDNPMPSDAKDRIAKIRKQNSDLYPPQSGSPTGRLSPAGPLSPDGGMPGRDRSKSHLKFEEADVVHQYGYGRQDDAYHSQQPHRETHSAPQHRPHLTPSKSSSGSVYQTLYEEPEDDSSNYGPSPLHGGTPVRTASPLGLRGASPGPAPVLPRERVSTPGGGEKSFDNPYAPAFIPDTKPQPRNRTPEPTSAISTKSGLSGIFNFGPNPELSLRGHDGHGHGPAQSHGVEDMRRGGAHRGTKDYPYRKDHGDADVEREERRGLFEDEGGVRMSEDTVGRGGGRMSEDIDDMEKFRRSLDYDPASSPPRPPRSNRRLPSPPLLEPTPRRPQ